uniref:Uncharacterized protein n=1 Tax=Solanum tuberosum TaxID=4113 RepID=M0ZQH5_SOLTU
MKNLNNELLKIDVSRPKLCFGVVVWITMPKPADISKVQVLIAKRLSLDVDKEEGEESTSHKIYERLKKEKSFLLILDDVWEAINLDRVGVPNPINHAGSNVIITSRDLGVCKKMKSDTKMDIHTLDVNESWQLFIKNAGDVANEVDIEPLAKEIASECGGLPLAITVIATSMRGKSRVEMWEDALTSLRMSEPCDNNVIHDVFKVIKLSFDYLESPDTGSKRKGDIKICFLYCSLYPQTVPIDDLICCLWAEGFLGEHDTYEEAYNRGITIVESLKDASLLEEAYKVDYVKMHDVVRDVAKWIANNFGNEHISVFQAGIGLTEISHTTKVSAASVKRISFASNKIDYLPDCFTECLKTTSLLLQHNESLVKIPDIFFLSFPALRVLNLSHTGIRALPCSINELRQLHALILQHCRMLRELPSIGNLCNLQLLDCDRTMLRYLPEGMDKLTNLRLLNMPNLESSIGQGFFLKLSSIEIVDMMGCCLGATYFDELSSLRNLTSLFIRVDSSSIFNRDHKWMSRLKRYHIEIGEASGLGLYLKMSKKRDESEFGLLNKSTRMISISKSEIFSDGELSSMLQCASHLYLANCMGLRKLIVNKKSTTFDGLKSLHIESCSCDFTPAEEGNEQFDDPLPNLEHLSLFSVHNLKSVSDFGQLLGLRFSGLRQLEISSCRNLTCLFNAFSVPNHLEEIPRVRKLVLRELTKLGTFGEPESMWEHLEELEVFGCYGIRKLPLSIQTSNNIKLIRGSLEWWSRLKWDDEKYKSYLWQFFRMPLPPKRGQIRNKIINDLMKLSKGFLST